MHAYVHHPVALESARVVAAALLQQHVLSLHYFVYVKCR